MARYTLEADPEQFTEADIESLEFVLEDLEEMEAESTESINLEDVNPESVAGALEDLMEGTPGAPGAAANGNGQAHSRRYSSPSGHVHYELGKVFTTRVKKKVQKIMSNPKTRAKLEAAIRKGPTAVDQLIAPSVAQDLQVDLRWLAWIYVPPVTLALFGPIRQQAGVKAEEVEEVSEIFPLLGL
jgi:hypothetical protein